MTELTQDLSLAQAHSLIDSYAFDLGNKDAEQLLEYWLELYDASWIRLATIEALYLGRYKAISIEHILTVWLRIGSPNTHFTYEFERLICRKLPKHLSNLSEMVTHPNQTEIALHQTSTEASQSATVDNQSTASQQHIPTTEDNNLLNLAKAWETSLQKASAPQIPIISPWELIYTPDWSELSGKTKTIHQFIPLPDVSSFFNKLKTFGEEKLEGQ